MEDGVKEAAAQCKEPKFLSKAGWVKKAPGRLLANYKDRYVHVEKTEIVVYDNEALQTCLERLDLENYDKCHELKSPFKKKHRLVLIRSTKAGNKVSDVKFQAQTAEEKAAWIKALTDGINRAKNKVFDEVKLDDSSNLEHVTRTRPKGNRNRRPPTRIHMKEVAVVSSDGILRLDLDLEDAVLPIRTHCANDDGTENSKETIEVSLPICCKAAEEHTEASGPKGSQIEPDVNAQKNVIKPPMPPTKEAKPSPLHTDEPDKDNSPEKKVVKPPMPPSKEAKLWISPAHANTNEAIAEMSEKSQDTSKKTPPTPPNKPCSSSSFGNLAELPQSTANIHPPTPPSKEKKPINPTVDPDKWILDIEKGNKNDDIKIVLTGNIVEKDIVDSQLFKEAVVSVAADLSFGTAEQVLEEVLGDTLISSCPPLTSKEKTQKVVQSDTQHLEENPTVRKSQQNGIQDPVALLQAASNKIYISLEAEEPLPKSEVPSVVDSSNDLPPDSLTLCPPLCHLPVQKKRKAEEKSVDSGQHSDNDSEGFWNEDTLAASTGALRGSQASLDVLNDSKENIPISGQHSDNIQIAVSLRPAIPSSNSQVKSDIFLSPDSNPSTPLKPFTKVRSASIGDLLSDSDCFQIRPDTTPLVRGDRFPTDDVMKLQNEVALQMETTDKLLSQVVKLRNKGDGADIPGNLLAEAIEKLKKADLVLTELKKLELAKKYSNRKSW